MHSKEVGYGLDTLEQTNCAWMILSWKIKIYKRPSWSTEVLVKTWPREFGIASSWRDFEVFDETGDKVAIATSEWILMNAREKSIGRITEKMVNDYGKVERKVFDEEFTGKLKEPDNMQKIYEYTVGRRDIDVNHHVNNVMYLEFAYNAFPKDMNIDFNNIEVYYKKQIKIGETVAIFYSEDKDTNIVSIRSLDGKKLHAVLKFKI